MRALLVLVVLSPVAVGADPDVAKRYEDAGKKQLAADLAKLDDGPVKKAKEEADRAKADYAELKKNNAGFSKQKEAEKKWNTAKEQLAKQLAKREELAKLGTVPPRIPASKANVGDVGVLVNDLPDELPPSMRRPIVGAPVKGSQAEAAILARNQMANLTIGQPVQVSVKAVAKHDKQGVALIVWKGREWEIHTDTVGWQVGKSFTLGGSVYVKGRVNNGPVLVLEHYEPPAK